MGSSLPLPKIALQGADAATKLLLMVASGKLAVRHPDFGRRLQSKAKEKGLQIADIQRALKVTYEMARRYWEGIAKPRHARMKALAALLTCSVAWLEYGERGPDQAAEKRAPFGSSDLADDALEIARVFQMLSPIQQDFYRSQMFRDAALGKVAPWLNTSRLAGDFDQYERGIERDFQRRARQLSLETK